MFCHCLLYTFSLLILLLLFHNLFCRIVLLVKQIDHFDRKKMFCFVQPCLFVQSGHRIFLVKCQGNLCNVGAATGYYQKINWSKIKFAKKWYSDDIGLGFFLCNVVWSLLGNIAQGFYLCNLQCCPKSINTSLNRIFSCSLSSWASNTILHKIFTCVVLVHC